MSKSISLYAFRKFLNEKLGRNTIFIRTGFMEPNRREKYYVFYKTRVLDEGWVNSVLNGKVSEKEVLATVYLDLLDENMGVTIKSLKEGYVTVKGVYFGTSEIDRLIEIDSKLNVTGFAG